jgi:hypothetical protein
MGLDLPCLFGNALLFAADLFSIKKILHAQIWLAYNLDFVLANL